jgi:hypothetical protein
MKLDIDEAEFRERLIKAAQRRARLIRDGKLRSSASLPIAVGNIR